MLAISFKLEYVNPVMYVVTSVGRPSELPGHSALQECGVPASRHGAPAMDARGCSRAGGLALHGSHVTCITVVCFIKEVNSLAHERCGSNFTRVFSNPFYALISQVLPVNLIFRWVPQNPIDDAPILVQVMAWCRQATSHYMSQCWPRTMSPH